jgi:hypothetical protein
MDGKPRGPEFANNVVSHFLLLNLILNMAGVTFAQWNVKAIGKEKTSLVKDTTNIHKLNGPVRSADRNSSSSLVV